MDRKDVETCENIVKGRMILPRNQLGSEDREVRGLLGWMLDADPSVSFPSCLDLKGRYFRDGDVLDVTDEVFGSRGIGICVDSA